MVMRHSDVPRQVFDDLWATIRAGQAWSGVVKNAHSDGSGFWLRLTATPVVKEGQVSSVLEVGTPASPAEMAQAQVLFRRLKRSEGSLKQGRWVPARGMRGVAAWFAGSLHAQHHAMVALLVLPACVLAALFMPPGWPFWSVLGGLGALALGMAWVYHVTVVRPLRQLTQCARRAASGMLETRFGIGSASEIGQSAGAVEQLTMSLMGVLREVRREAVSIWDTTEQVAQGGVHLSDRTEQQAANLEQTSSAMQQFSQSTSDNAYATAQASGIAMTMSDQARAGGKAVHRVVETMRELEASSRRIGDIIGVIDGLSFQTNILALNAAVEAGRAGTEGRGFAVVAGEVRRLAQRSATAAREIKVLIEESVRSVDAAVGIVHTAGVTMDQTVQSVAKVSRLIEEISAATGGQATEIAQVTAAVRQLDEMTQQNAALVEESASATEALKQQAGRLVGLADVFKVNAVL